MASPGYTATHGASSMKRRPVASIVPQDGFGGWVPRPRKDKVGDDGRAAEDGQGAQQGRKRALGGEPHGIAIDDLDPGPSGRSSPATPPGPWD